MNFLLYIIIIISFLDYSNNKNNTLIISLSCNYKNIFNINLIINSILNQNVNQSLYKILLIASNKEIPNKYFLPKSILLLINLKKIKLIMIDSKINLQTKLIVAIKYYPNNPILIINENTIFPEGWLEMFIKDHKKYPKDIIIGSVQFFFGNNLKIKQLSEGYNGKYFGIFNHITGIIFNFAFVNTNLGGTLYPENCFKNKFFFDLKLFLKISKNSDEFWQSCFIMIEQKTLRQSSKIFDYTQYIILNNDIDSLIKRINNKKKIYEKNIRKFLKYFPDFKTILENRQNKILISLTSYNKRFDFLPSVINSLKKQISFKSKKIVLILAKEDKKLYNLNITGVNIFTVNEDLKPHNKYYYMMMKYRDYAIITVDDDIIYTEDMFISLFNSYIEHPNIVSGRRAHLMKYKPNGELNDYIYWIKRQKNITNPDFNIFLTGVGGIIYPPDIFQMKEEYLPIINETITGDDLTLKYFETIKGIEEKWVPNNHLKGLKTKINSKHEPLYKINTFNNNIYIKKVNIAIENEIIENLCVNYKNLKTGLTIFLFNINNIHIDNDDFTRFDIEAYSFCPIDNNIKFKIYFDKIIANCKFENSYSIIQENNKIYKTSKILKASCFINEKINNLNYYYFPKVISQNSINIKLYNYQKYQPIIFKDFYLFNSGKYLLKALFYKNFEKGYNIKIRIINKKYNCILNKDIIYFNNGLPILNSFNCNIDNSIDNSSLFIIDLPFDCLRRNEKSDNSISNQFIISKIYLDFINRKYFIIIKGKFINDLKINIYNIKVNFLSPNISCFCNIINATKYVQSYIYCNITNNNQSQLSKFLIKNQIIYSENDKYNLLLINKETLFQNYKIIIQNKSYKEKNKYMNINKLKYKIYPYLFSNYMNISYSFFIIFLIIKLCKSIKNIKKIILIFIICILIMNNIILITILLYNSFMNNINN